MKYIIVIAAAFLLGTAGFAQDSKTEAKKEAQKEKDKTMKEYDEIIIKRKDDKNAKVVIEIKGDEVMVDGKPLDEYVNDEVSVRLRSPQRFNINMNESMFRQPGGGRAFLGVMTSGSTDGAKIEEVTENSAAAKAGLKTGDIITKINDKAVYDHEQLTEVISKLQPQEKITITYKRNGKTNTTSATLGKRKDDDLAGRYPGPGAPMAPMAPMPPMPPMEFNFDDDAFPRIYKFRTEKPRLGIKVRDTEDGKGVEVIDVDDESSADNAGIEEDDIITSFDGRIVNSAEDLARMSREVKDKTSIQVQLKRDGKTKTVTLKIPKKLKTAEL
ncbi:MAG: PDZ domain-containing protein [Chitinophagaceae bacterium]|nr:PDZ domain-containing protein [Chitinophagaceae bacterium]